MNSKPQSFGEVMGITRPSEEMIEMEWAAVSQKVYSDSATTRRGIWTFVTLTSWIVFLVLSLAFFLGGMRNAGWGSVIFLVISLVCFLSEATSARLDREKGVER